MNKVIVITGPTGIGKTRLSITIAKHFNGEIINADSMQIYKGLDIGTAKISESEKEGIPHHLFDIREIEDDYSVYDYQRDGRLILDNLNTKKIPIIVGGTGLYIKALLYNYSFNKENQKYDFSHLTNEQLYDELKKYNNGIDIHINNRQRLERYLNKYMNNNTIVNDRDELLYDTIFIGLTTDRDTLYNIINKRVDKMIANGLIDEVKAIYDRGIRSKSIMTGIGYKELYQYFDGEISLEDAISIIKQNSRRYAKRQYTWFNHQMKIKWFDVKLNNFEETEAEIISYIEKNL
ncbi:MAG: tRNA (adenosine(37)-N6)-dimethylallyltransferase MiaA [Bacilli bacterium]|nr:tRNA (adenosine(37)-N6)-dimethylallyltransferase MiaA [Bacilli bacterium]MDD4643860.1 tRNA (adenosine(37)-N6)-dimethylallyltransferase MiaA [Bacilli bacterium]